MVSLLIALGALLLYVVAYHTYGKFLARKIFRLDPDAVVPSAELEDGEDYVPTAKSVVFGHHFTSIAGTGPIVGPALAVIWGWVPALVWVLVGSIVIGAVHDFGSLVISLRNRGQTVGDIAGRVLAPRARVLFLTVLFLALTIVLAIFGLVIAAVFRIYPSAIFPCLFQIPLAVGIGIFLHRKGAGLLVPSLVALALMYLSVFFGDIPLLHGINSWLAGQSTLWWVAVLLIYSYIASVLPVWTLLQPRDFINSLQLLSAVGLIVLGLVVAAFSGDLQIVAPAVRTGVPGAPMMIPFLFITIACGAISGFHCLVSSGTSSKQLKNESDAQAIGFGSMLTEGFLAVLVILACVAGLGMGESGAAAYTTRYETWNTAAGLGAKVGAFVEGSANFLGALGLPAQAAIALMGVFVASFAATTLDTACRLQRYVTQELAATLHVKPLMGKHGATLFAVAVAFFIAAVPAPGKGAGSGGLNLWPLFGATNQLLAGLAFLVIIFWMARRGLPLWFVAVPGVLMLLLPGAALGIEVLRPEGWLATGQWILVTIAGLTLAVEIWMIVEALRAWPKAKGVLEPQLPPLPRRVPEEARVC